MRFFNRERKFHVSYNWSSEKQSGFGSIVITMTGKLTDEAVLGMKKYIDDKHEGQTSIILAITELES